MVLHDVARIGRTGIDDLVDATLGEASSADDIGNMDSPHPIDPLRLDAGVNGYRNAINNHAVVASVAGFVLIFVAIHANAVATLQPRALSLRARHAGRRRAFPICAAVDSLYGKPRP